MKEVVSMGEQEQVKQELIHSNLIKRKDVPDFFVNFSMERLQLTLINSNEKYEGIEFTMEDFFVKLKMFDALNKH
jgi:hypothetical protein